MRIRMKPLNLKTKTAATCNLKRTIYITENVQIDRYRKFLINLIRLENYSLQRLKIFRSHSAYHVNQAVVDQRLELLTKLLPEVGNHRN